MSEYNDLLKFLVDEWKNTDEATNLADMLFAHSYRRVPADAVVVTEESLVRALLDADNAGLLMLDDIVEKVAAFILAALREGER